MNITQQNQSGLYAPWSTTEGRKQSAAKLGGYKIARIKYTILTIKWQIYGK